MENGKKYTNIIKIFGFNSDEIALKLKTVFDETAVVEFETNRYDSKIVISSDDEKKCFSATKKIAQFFKLNMYADTDISLHETLVQCCALFNKKLIVFDNVTEGIILSRILQLQNAQNYVKICFVVPDLTESLDLNFFDFDEMKNLNLVCESISGSLLKNDYSSLAVILLKKESNQLISVSDSERINIFEQNFNSSDEHFYEDICNTAIFYAIQKLKQNDLKFYADSI